MMATGWCGAAEQARSGGKGKMDEREEAVGDWDGEEDPLSGPAERAAGLLVLLLCACMCLARTCVRAKLASGLNGWPGCCSTACSCKSFLFALAKASSRASYARAVQPSCHRLVGWSNPVAIVQPSCHRPTQLPFSMLTRRGSELTHPILTLSSPCCDPRPSRLAYAP